VKKQDRTYKAVSEERRRWQESFPYMGGLISGCSDNQIAGWMKTY